MHAVPGHMRTLCAEKIAAKQESAHMETAPSIDMLLTISLAKSQEKSCNAKQELTHKRNEALQLWASYSN